MERLSSNRSHKSHEGTHEGSRYGGLVTAAAAFATAAFAGMITAAAAFGGQVTPEAGGSASANDTESLYKFVLVVALVVFVFAEAALIYTIVRFRERRGRSASQIRAKAGIELLWAAIPLVVLGVIATVTFARLNDIQNPPGGKLAAQVRLTPEEVSGQSQQQSGSLPARGEPVTIKIQGQRYLWRYTYPNGAFSFRELVVPANTVVNLDITAQDVIHSWWVPKLGGKVDAVPGYVTHTWLKPLKTGTFEGQCAEFCGLQHARMLATVRVVSPEEWQQWVRRQEALIGEAQNALKES